MSHRCSVTARPRARAWWPAPETTPIAAFENPERRQWAVQFHPEVVHTQYGQDVLKNFLHTLADVPPAWTPAAVIEEQVERIRAQVGTRARPLRAVRRRRLVRRGAPRPQGDRRPAHLRLRRPRLHARGRGGAGRRDVPGPLPRATRARDRRRTASSHGSPASRSPRRSGSASARSSSDVFEEEAEKIGDCKYLVQGTLYSGRDRVGRHRRRRGEDQVAPQRRRPARGHGDGARRAAARPVQGRGAPRRRGARHCRRSSSGASRSRGRGSRSGSSAR